MNAFKTKKIKHIAIIMDGNGRWAESRAHRRIWGHIRGSSVVSKLVESADEAGVEALTLYAFSTENFSRPLDEIRTLFQLLKKFLKKERDRLIKNKIQFKVIGHLDKIPEGTRELIRELEFLTKEHDGLKLTFAFGYGGRTEIVDAVNKFLIENPGKAITEEDLQNNFYHPKTKDVDLLIRTGGDKRISNFLLWQLAYAELYFTTTAWPDFGRPEFISILKEVEQRERRFGHVKCLGALDEAKKMAKKNSFVLGRS